METEDLQANEDTDIKTRILQNSWEKIQSAQCQKQLLHQSLDC